MKGIYSIENPTKEALKPTGGPPPGGPASSPPAGGPPPMGGPAGGSPAGGPPPMGGPAGGSPAGGPPPMGGPMAATLTLKWDGTSALWVNEMGQEVVLEDLKETADTLTFTAMAGPAPIEWTIRKEGVGFTAVSHRGADIHGNPPVDTTCTVTCQPL